MKKSILIIDENKDLINKMCLDAHGNKEKERLADFEIIKSRIQNANLFCQELLKKHLKGLRYGYGLYCNMPNSYKYKYEADFFVIEWTQKGWALVCVTRKEFWPSQKSLDGFFFNLKDEDKKQRQNEIKEHLYNSKFKI